MVNRSMKRRQERIIDFNEATLTAIPVSQSGCDHWYDKADPRLIATRLGPGKPIMFRFSLGRPERRALGLSSTTPYSVIGKVSLEEARAKSAEMMARLAEAMKKHEAGEPTASFDAGRAARKLMADPPDDGKESYSVLMSVLMDAYAQAANGKGSERHSSGGKVPFEKQDMLKIQNATSMDFALGQAIKKVLEGRRMKKRKMMRAEFLGAIVYIAGAVVSLDGQGDDDDE